MKEKKDKHFLEKTDKVVVSQHNEKSIKIIPTIKCFI